MAPEKIENITRWNAFSPSDVDIRKRPKVKIISLERPKFVRNSLLVDSDSKFLNLELSYFICNGSDSYQIAYTPDTEKTKQLIDAVAYVRLQIITYYTFRIKF